MLTQAIGIPDDSALALSLRDLRSVAAIAQEGSLTAAATRLGFSQATISAHLAAAEKALGVSLFERHGRGVVLTEAGRTVLRHATTMFGTLGELYAAARGLDRQALVIGASEPAGSRRMLSFIRQAERADPTLELSLRVAGMTENLGLVERGELELALTAARKDFPRTVKFTPLYEQELVLLVHEQHPLAGKRRVDLRALDAEQLLVGEDTCIYRRLVEQTIRNADVDVVLRARIGPTTTLPHAVASRLGVAILPDDLVESPPAQTVVVTLRDPILTTIGSLVRTDASETARRVANALRSYFAPPLPGKRSRTA